MTVIIRVAAAAAALGGAAWIVKAAAILATGDQPPVLFQAAPLLLAVGLIGIRVLLGPAGTAARLRGLVAWTAVLLAAASLAPDAGTASSDGDFQPLVLATFLCILAGLVLLGLPARRRADLPWPTRVLPLLLGLLTFPLLAVGGALSVLHERLLELPLVVLGGAWLVLAQSMWTADRHASGGVLRAAGPRPSGTEGAEGRLERRRLSTVPVVADSLDRRTPPMSAGQRLRGFTAAVIVLNVVATVVAVTVNWPSQFGMTGTDARREFLTSGTAISAPPLPVVLLLAVVALGGRADRWRWVGIAAAYLAAASVAVGGFGELVADPTEDTPKAVLLGAGIVWIAIAVVLAVLATAAAARPRSTHSSHRQQA